MYLLESIKILNGRIYNLRFHQARFENSRRDLFGIHEHPSLRKEIQIPKKFQTGLIKCRIEYARKIKNVQFCDYKLKVIHSLQLVEFNGSYNYKFIDRELLNLAYAQRGKHSDVLLVKEGIITDSYYCNLAFKKKEKWYTPKEALLQGTKRAKLLEQKKILSKTIRVNDIDQYSHISLFNAMIPFKKIILPVQNIH